MSVSALDDDLCLFERTFQKTSMRQVSLKKTPKAPPERPDESFQLISFGEEPAGRQACRAQA